MKKLVLYSDQVIGKSDRVDAFLLEMIDKANPRIGYIPSRGDLTRKYYNQKCEYYRNLGINDVLYFDIDIEYDSSGIDELAACDAIHLSGGDTAYFISIIKKRGFDGILNRYVQNGGILIGVSAGSILMSGCIGIVSVLHDGKNGLDKTDSLGLCDFEFVPHWERNCVYLEQLKEYSEQRKTAIYACGDRDGIIVDDNEITFVGDVIQIRNGMVKHM